MRANLTKHDWEKYQTHELAAFEEVFTRLGLVLDTIQLHTGGERYLMSGRKLVLTGTQEKDGERVVVKASTDSEGRIEIRHEKEARDLLQTLSFAKDVLLSPKELYFEDTAHHTILVTAFVQQSDVFAARPLREQFFLALRVLEAQEGFHATTYGHEKRIKNVFPILQSRDYLSEFDGFIKNVHAEIHKKEFDTLLDQARAFLAEHTIVIDRYAPYLSHTDLAPHNMRVSDHGIFLLDYASFHFGNKYEGWARFLNYMLLHNQELEALLTEHVRKNRGPDEYLSLRLMRVYKIGFLLAYYAKALSQTTGNLHTLTAARIAFWTGVLESFLSDIPLSHDIIATYARTRDSLRSEEEIARQREFAIA